MSRWLLLLVTAAIAAHLLRTGPHLAKAGPDAASAASYQAENDQSKKNQAKQDDAKQDEAKQDEARNDRPKDAESKRAESKSADPKSGEQIPVEEDENLATKEYTFNPLQASKELNVANQYLKKGAYKAAALRCEEAVKWDPNLAEAWLKLGEAREKLNDPKRAAEAYTKYLEIAVDARNTAEIRSKVRRLEKR